MAETHKHQKSSSDSWQANALKQSLRQKILLITSLLFFFGKITAKRT